MRKPELRLFARRTRHRFDSSVFVGDSKALGFWAGWPCPAWQHRCSLVLGETGRVDDIAQVSALAETPGLARPTRRRRIHDAWALPVVAGALSSLFLVGVYLGLVTWAQGLEHARELLWGDRYFVAGIASGFGLQVGLFVHVRRLVAKAAAGSAAGITAAGTGTSTAAMVACCAHHVADALPLIGLSGAAIFLNDYRIPLMAAGLAVNALGVAFMLRLVVMNTRLVRREASAY